jgi:hypothetical protein
MLKVFDNSFSPPSRAHPPPFLFPSTVLLAKRSYLVRDQATIVSVFFGGVVPHSGQRSGVARRS